MNRHFYLLTLDIYGIKNIANPIHLDFYKKTIRLKQFMGKMDLEKRQ